MTAECVSPQASLWQQESYETAHTDKTQQRQDSFETAPEDSLCDEEEERMQGGYYGDYYEDERWMRRVSEQWGMSVCVGVCIATRVRMCACVRACTSAYKQVLASLPLTSFWESYICSRLCHFNPLS